MFFRLPDGDLISGFGNFTGVEFENGERLKLRNLNAHKMILSAGDVGILRYKGMTIEAFQREGMRNQNTHQFGSWG